MDVKSLNGEKFEIFSNFFAHPVETPWPILTVLHQNVRRSVPYILDYTFGIAEKNRNGSCPMHELDHPHVISPLFAPQGVADPQKGRRHVPTQATPACKIWRESARGLLRNR